MNKALKYLLLIATLVIIACRTSPPSKVKIIEEKDPVVKTIEEKDSIRIITDTIKNIQRKK